MTSGARKIAAHGGRRRVREERRGRRGRRANVITIAQMIPYSYQLRAPVRVERLGND